MNNFLLEESKFDPFEIACSKDSLEEKDNISANSSLLKTSSLSLMDSIRVSLQEITVTMNATRAINKRIDFFISYGLQK